MLPLGDPEVATNLRLLPCRLCLRVLRRLLLPVGVGAPLPLLLAKAGDDDHGREGKRYVIYLFHFVLLTSA